MENNPTFLPHKPDLQFAKVVATPTPTSWSQAYNAGGLFAVLSLTQQEGHEEETLQSLGKKMLEIFQDEYFTLETKNLSSIKEAVTKMLEAAPSHMNVSFAGASINQAPQDPRESILYIFTSGFAKVMVKRGEKLGTILSNEEQLTGASGILASNDVVILQTKAFSDHILQDDLASALSSATLQEAAEAIAPKMHEVENGTLCAILISFTKRQAEQELIDEQLPQQPTSESDEQLSTKTNLPFSFPSLNIPSFGQSNPKKRLYLSVALLILAVLIVGVLFALREQQNQARSGKFKAIYPAAQKKFEEGQGLIGLNKNLARDDLTSAQKMLQDAKDQFPQNTPERKQVDDLLAKINENLTTVSDTSVVDASATDDDKSQLLSIQKKNNIKYATSDDANVYYLDQDGIKAFDKKTQKTKTLAKSSWKQAAGIGTYLGNIYLTDIADKTILKLVSSDDGYSKTSYLKEEAPDTLSKAIDTTVDTSVWVLTQDAKILKFTRGKQESFNISGLEKPLSSPTKIFTNTNSDHLYVLDQSNGRVVLLSKTGSFQEQYQAKIIQKATSFDVVEKDKAMYILADQKIYLIHLH